MLKDRGALCCHPAAKFSTQMRPTWEARHAKRTPAPPPPPRLPRLGRVKVEEPLRESQWVEHRVVVHDHVPSGLATKGVEATQESSRNCTCLLWQESPPSLGHQWNPIAEGKKRL